jgi:hypothetical protein
MAPNRVVGLNCSTEVLWTWQPVDCVVSYLPDVAGRVRIPVPQTLAGLTPDKPMTQDASCTIRSRVLTLQERLTLAVLLTVTTSAAGAKLID